MAVGVSAVKGRTPSVRGDLMPQGITIKDEMREIYQFRLRTVIAALFALLLMAILVARLAYLQIYLHEHYSTLSHNNRVTIKPIAPTRGLIFDLNGVVLAQNLPIYSIEITPERVADMEATLAAIGALIPLHETDLERFHTNLIRQRRFESIPLRYRLSDSEVARIAVNRHRLPGVEIQSRLSRDYPLGTLVAHVVGYVGNINENELREIDTSNYAATRRIGKVGIEKSYEQMLHGTVGFQQVETNARGRILRVLERTDPIPGKNLYLNIDINLQREAERAFANERGALVMIEPESGAVLALVSIPSYDPNLFVDGIARKTYRAILNDPAKPFFNRALRGQYPPGSTTKPFIGLAGLANHLITPRSTTICPGYYTLENDDHRYRDWKREGHGIVNLPRAIIESCDVYFYDLSFRLGIDRISTFMKQYGFGEQTGIDISGEASGLIPSRAWKRRVRQEPWFPGETLITGIGQGFMLSTPLQLAHGTAALATRGQRRRPQVVRLYEDPVSNTKTPIMPVIEPTATVQNVGHWESIHKAMESVIHTPTGTAHRISQGLAYRMAGKTGTAQVFGIKQDEEYVPEDVAKRLRDHALFIAFAPLAKPRVAVAVVVENGGSGSAVAAPITRQVMDRHLLNEKNQLKP